MTKICLVGIDGLRLDIARQQAATLRRLIETGALAAMRIDVPTISGPSWTTLLTGASYAEHGIVDNTFDGGSNAVLPDFLTRIADAYPAATTFAAASWPPLVDPGGPGPVIHSRQADQRAGRHVVIICNGEGGNYPAADVEVAAAAATALAAGADASFVYFGEADAAAHAHGGMSAEYRAAIGRIDDHLHAVVDAITGRAASTGEDWALVITTDHGHLDEGGHGGGSAVETASFALACCFGPTATHPGAGPKGWPERMQPIELTGWLIELASR
jgi:hypothetical protein